MPSRATWTTLTYAPRCTRLDWRWPLDPTISGEKQTDWLIASLTSSTATWKFIVSGTPDEMKHSNDPLVRQFVHGLTEGPLTDRRRAGGYEVDLLGGAT